MNIGFLFKYRFLREQAGLTLIELLVALAVGAVILIGAGMMSSQIMSITIESRHHLEAVRHVQNAGKWIGSDSQQAQTIGISQVEVTSPFEGLRVLTLNWDYSQWGQSHCDVDYILLTDGSLWRVEYLNGSLTPNSTIIVAEGITVFNVTGSYNITIRSEIGGFRPAFQELEYLVQKRSGS